MILGTVLNERYKIIRYIGGGGMANVYLGEDLILNREVALKVLKPEYSNNTEFIERFRREAESAISLSNDHIVNIFDVGKEDETYYMVMEYIDGMTLKEYIHHKGSVSTQEAVAIMLQLTDAINHAHDNGIIHRDIKPQNILMNQTGAVKITDFGIARALSSTSFTKTNDVMGSVHYLSPEQARGGVATKKSDIYSLGIVFYELLTGRMPFSGESAVSVALKHMQTDTPFVRSFDESIPQSVENVVLKSTVKNPLHRYQTIDELEADLQTVLHADRSDEARYVPPVEVGEETKAIPAIKDQAQFTSTNKEETLLMNKHNKEDRPPKKSKKWIAFVTSGIILAIASIVIALFVLPGLFMPNDVTVPDMEGYTYEEAVTELSNLGLEVERDSVFSDEMEEGYVLRSSPRANSSVKEGSLVTLVTSLGQEKIEFPDYIGSDFEETRRYLESNGYREVISYGRESDRPEGEIIGQVQPDPGEEIIPEETRVIFDVSLGPPTVSLSSFAGWSLEAVQEYIRDNNLTLSINEENSDEVPEGRIIRQNPSPNTELQEGENVTIYVSEGPDLQPQTREISLTVEYNDDLDEDTAEDEESDEDSEEESEEESEESEPQGQEVQIFIDDMENDMNEPAFEDTIFEDTTYTFEVTIEPEESASYRVLRDGEVYQQETIDYD